MIQSTTQQSEKVSEKDLIRPFRKTFSDAELDELRRRIEATRWPDRETVNDEDQGVQLATAKKLAEYWATEYDWRQCEARLNSFPQFVTEIDGLDIHFIHVRSQHETALPLILTHGWPGSVIEMLKVIEPLTNPTAHGGTAADAFHVVIPSLPGHGFSAHPKKPGCNPDRIAKAWTTLMRRLGYNQFVAQGGDWGGLITDLLGVQAPPELLGIHSNMPGTVTDDITKATQADAPVPQELNSEERRAYEQLCVTYKHVGYAALMSTRPQTLTALADSPVGLAAFFLDHDIVSYKLIARVFNGAEEGLSRDDVLDNITLYWLTNTAVSAARLYWENKHNYFSVKNVKVPAAVSAFPDELYQTPRSWAEKAYSKLIYYNRVNKGGHFAAWEQPELFTQELRAAFKTLRQPTLH